MTNKERILNTAQNTSAEVYEEHIRAFVASFIEKMRQDRWLYLLLERPKSAFKNSHKLYGDISRKYCVPSDNINSLLPKQVGVYYDFYFAPCDLTVEDAITISSGNDAIFSIHPGKLAIYFFHESEILLCQRQ